MAGMGRGNEAYDLSLFEPKPAKVVQLVPDKRRARAQKKQRRIQSLLNTAATLLTAGLAVLAVGLVIACRVHLTEMDSRIKTQQQELNNLQSEYVRLTSELAAKTSAQQVEDYATQVLGMQKADPGQIQYITVQGGSEVELVDPQGRGLLETIGSAISDFFSELTYLFQ
ncbi:MAG: hypothetical protein HFJ80_03495 [Clostridiales bacterium]|nr:hypothetical protein [Clostridiales bacterium]